MQLYKFEKQSKKNKKLLSFFDLSNYLSVEIEGKGNRDLDQRACLTEVCVKR